MSYMKKTEVYSWRIAPDLKSALEEAARERGESVAALLEDVVREWLRGDPAEEDGDRQERLHAAAARHLGRLAGGDSDRSAGAAEELRQRLRRRRDRA